MLVNNGFTINNLRYAGRAIGQVMIWRNRVAIQLRVVIEHRIRVSFNKLRPNTRLKVRSDI